MSLTQTTIARSDGELGYLAAPNFENFSAKDGLSDEIYSVVGMDANGFVWAGSASGLYRFDGYRWQHQDVGGASSLVRDMLTDPNGHLWAIFEREGLAVNRNGTWSLTGDESFYHRFNSSRTADGEPVHWLGQPNRVYQLQNGQWQTDPDWLPPGSERITSVAQTEDLLGGPRLWVARTRGSLWSRPLDDPDAQWEAVDTGDFDGALYTDLVVSRSEGLEELWVLSYGSGILRLRADGQQRRWRKVGGPLPSEAIYSGVVTYDDTGQRSLWISSRGGLLRFKEETFSVFDRSDGLPSNAVRGIKRLSDHHGRDILWLATERGVTRLRLEPSAWRTVSRLGAAENGIFGVFADQDARGQQRVVIGSGMAGLAVFSDGRWTEFNQANGRLSSDHVRGVWPLNQGRALALVSMDNGRLFTLSDDLTLTELEIDWPLGRLNGVIDVVEAFGETWLGTMDSSIYRIDGPVLKRLHPPVLDSGRLQALDVQIDASGNTRVWGASTHGLVRIDRNNYAKIETRPGRESVSYRDITVVEHETGQELWTSTERHGVLRYDLSQADNPTLINDSHRPPVPDPTVYSVSSDSEGRIYVCTNNGVQQLIPLSNGRFHSRVFRRQDGLVHDECNSRSQFVDQEDRFWVGTLAGLSVYDPALDSPSQRERAPSPLHLTALEIDGRIQTSTMPDPLVMPAGAQTLTAHVALLTQQRETDSEYRFVLSGPDKGTPPRFSDWTKEPSRTWPAPEPGAHLLRIEARDFAGIPAHPVEIPIQIEASWFERPGVRATLAISVLVLAFCSAALYTRQLRQRKATLETLVAQRTEDLAKANRQLVKLSFSDPLTGAANRRRLDLAGRDELKRAAITDRKVSLILLDLDHFKQFNDRHGHLAGDLALQCVAEHVAAAIRPGDLIARFGGEEFACLLPDTDANQAEVIAERIRRSVSQGSESALGHRYDAVTISAGVATSQSGESKLKNLIKRADQALYEAKRAGRDRVVLWTPAKIENAESNPA